MASIHTHTQSSCHIFSFIGLPLTRTALLSPGLALLSPLSGCRQTFIQSASDRTTLPTIPIPYSNGICRYIPNYQAPATKRRPRRSCGSELLALGSRVVATTSCLDLTSVVISQFHPSRNQSYMHMRGSSEDRSPNLLTLPDTVTSHQSAFPLSETTALAEQQAEKLQQDLRSVSCLTQSKRLVSFCKYMLVRGK